MIGVFIVHEEMRLSAARCTMPASYIPLNREVEHPDGTRAATAPPSVQGPTGARLIQDGHCEQGAFHAAHSGSLETTAVVLGLRWLLRSSRRHGRRALLLIDTQVMLGARRKIEARPLLFDVV